MRIQTEREQKERYCQIIKGYVFLRININLDGWKNSW